MDHSQAQTWVDKMSASEPDEPNDKDFEGRPARYMIHWFFPFTWITSMWPQKFFRLGLGAKATPGVKRAAPTDPVERRLLGKVNAQKRKALEDENRTAKEVNEASDDDESESRTSAFNKKKPLPSVTSTPLGKKAKWQSVCIDYLSDLLVLVVFLTNSQTDAIFMGIVYLLIVQCVLNLKG